MELATVHAAPRLVLPLSANLDGLPIAAVVVDVAGTVLGCNVGAARLFRIRSDAAIGRRFADLDIGDGWLRLGPWVQHVGRTRQAIRLDDVVLRQPDGEAVMCAVTIAPVKDDEGAVVGALLCAEDRTEQRRDEFLAMLAHELRNPLAPILTAVEIIDRLGAHDARAHRFLEIIGRQTRHLAALVDDMLDMARIRSGKITLQRERLDVRDVARQAVDSLRQSGRGAGHRLAVSLGDKPLDIHGDRARLEQVIGNLVDNALKYTGAEGEIRISAARDGAYAVVRVTDEGVGIAPEVLPRIFDLFTQAAVSLDRSQGGLGLGLPLARALVEQHGGTLSAQSGGLGRGSEFVVRLPLIVAAAASAPPADQRAAAAGLRILIVEDNPDAQLALRVLLELSGHIVETAADGVRGIDLALTWQPDVAVIDIGLPHVHGYDVARRLRATPESKGIYLIALTGYGQAEDRQRAFDAGFDAHLVKPVDADDLAMVIAGALVR